MSAPKAPAFSEQLEALNACDEAREWVGTRSLEEAWAQCERGDWMLWLAPEVGVDRRTVVLAACACARLALQHLPAGEDRPRLAIEAAEAWARGDARVTLENVWDAGYAAAHVGGGIASRAGRAARAATCAADSCAADSHCAYFCASYVAVDKAGEVETLRKCADLVRGLITVDVVRAALSPAETDAKEGT